jgi:tetratricopeptide (TPR) repeat protein
MRTARATRCNRGTMPRTFACLLTALLTVLAAPGAVAQTTTPDAATAAPLGEVELRISCSPAARQAFDRGLALLHHMTYPQAREAFRAAAAADPGCAMAHWGVAMTLFTPLWPTRPDAAALQAGWQEVERARALAPDDVRERGFIAAAAAFFHDPAHPDYWARVRRWEAAQADLYDAFPDDVEVAAFHALAHLAAAPPTGDEARRRADHAASLLVAMHAAHPAHPGAMHYLVHANDVPGREGKSLEVTRRYDAAAPHNPHALHMPTHIYTRLGDWERVIAGNRRAAEAALEHPVGDHGELVWDEFAHAIEYLVYAHLQQGDDAAAARGMARLQAVPNLQPGAKTAFHLASIPSRVALERGDWSGAATLEPREPKTLEWDRYTWPEAIVRFARGLGAARQGRADEARLQRATLERLEATTRERGEDLFAQHVHVLALGLDGWIAQAGGDEATARTRLGEAAELEARIPKPPVTPGPTLPAYEMLGDLLLAQRAPVEALAAYRHALSLYPNRFNSLLGAARAAEAAGDAAEAGAHYQALLDIAGNGTRAAPLEEARAFLARAQ